MELMVSPGQVPKVIDSLERERLVSLINSMADGVIATDEGAKVALYNGAALNILDLNVSIQGKALSSVCKLVDKNHQPVDITRLVIHTPAPTSRRDLKLQYPDGTAISLYLSIAPVRLGFGEKGMRGHVLLLRDITREKSLEEERDEFISVVSHELRTPIAITEGNISNAQIILQKTADPSKIQEALNKAHEQILFLSGMVNDLAMLSRAERGKLVLEVEPINCHELIKSLVDNYQPAAVAKGLKIQTELDPNLELLNSSRLYLQEILQNLITNAIKYTEKGSVMISVHQREGGIVFRVADSGIGISRTDQQKIFSKFFRSEDYRTRSTKGTGLGLYVSAKLTKLINAKISLESEINKGTTFNIFVPNLK